LGKIRNIILLKNIPIVYNYIMTNQDFKHWRTKRGLSQGKLAKALGVRSMTVARWEWGAIRIPALLPLALEALEMRLKKGGKDGTIS
jgi:DNA-binding transcriptional regulator YiaG